MKIIIAIISSLTIFVSTAHAEYYLEFPEPLLANEIDLTRMNSAERKKSLPVKKQFVTKKHSHSHQKIKSQSPEIELYYVFNCGVNQCALPVYIEDCDDCAVKKHESMTRGYVHFVNTAGVYGKDPMAVGDSEDLRTADDNVMRYPDMNNQY